MTAGDVTPTNAVGAIPNYFRELARRDSIWSRYITVTAFEKTTALSFSASRGAIDTI
jgi:hypothetical protein